MTASTSSMNRCPAGHLFMLLVLAVLTGVLGMHGLAPGGVATAQTATGHQMMAAADGVPHEDGECAHTDGGSGHLDHADGTCAAAGTGSAYTPPALTGTVLHVPAAPSPTMAATGSPHDGRAPPDLFELQLPRI
ncbi:DUF6153 family protein [Streptomyces sp. NPDC051041]|uniref:DUF6153 family protein n=1 Tax=Streptomyces sp. NPDC051041 TaxID=3365640 RepID=UPI0037B3527A